MTGIAIVSCLLAFLVSAALNAWVVRQKREAWFDKPNERSLHSCPVPRLGGVGIWAGIIVGGGLALGILENDLNAYGLIAATILFLVALIDDRRPISPLTRLVSQVLAACLVVFGGQLYISWDIASGIWPWIGVLMLLWGINLYNFMDGMDGFAGAMAVVGFGALGILAFMQHQVTFALICSLLVTASAGFLCFNFPPARIFMGDSGSTVMGFAMVVISIAGWKRGIYPFWTPLVIFSPFWADATVTLLKRLLRGERIWQAHRQHFYQQCVLAGYSHRRVTVCYIVLMIICAGSAICGQLFLEGYNAAIVPLCWLFLYLIAAWGSDRVIGRIKVAR